jgi:predicted dehydrogenase
MKKLRIAIIGCHNMGKKHLNILQEYFADAAEVVGILNSTPESSARQAAELGLAYFNSLADITSDKVDGVIIATPA